MRSFINKYFFDKAPRSAKPRLLALQVVFPEPFTASAEVLARSLQAFHPTLRGVDFTQMMYSDDEAASGETIGRFKWSQPLPTLAKPRVPSSMSSRSGSSGTGTPTAAGDAHADEPFTEDAAVLLTHRVSVVVRPVEALPAQLYNACAGAATVLPVPVSAQDAYRQSLRCARSVAFLAYRTESLTMAALPVHTGNAAAEAALVAPMAQRCDALALVAAALSAEGGAVAVLNTDAHTSTPASVLTAPAFATSLGADGCLDLVRQPAASSLFCGLHALPVLDRAGKQLRAYGTSGGPQVFGQPDFVGYALSERRAEALRSTAALLWLDAMRHGTPLAAQQVLDVPAFVEGEGRVRLDRPRLDEINATGGASQHVLTLKCNAGWRDLYAAVA